MSLADLIRWSEENGTLVSSELKFQELKPNNISCIGAPKKDEKKGLGDRHIRLPLDLSIGLGDAIKSFNNGKSGVFEEISSKTSSINSLLKLYLARERSSAFLAQSKFKYYISLLPNLKDINSPYTWSPEDLECIKGTNLGSSLKENLAAQVEEWWQIINLLPEDVNKPVEHFINMKFYYEFKFYKETDLYDLFVHHEEKDNWTSFTSYLWASMILKSRSFPAYLMKEVKNNADIKIDEVMLLPIIDLLNHNPKSNVEWSVTSDNGINYFDVKLNDIEVGKEVFNNYGRKGNEELLLAYGFCIPDNVSDTVALKIKIDMDLLPELESYGIKLPKLEEYTTAVVRSESSENKDKYEEYKNGILFFINEENVPEDLIKLFQYLVRTPWEDDLTLRSRLAGINQLRNAIETKIKIINDCKKPSTTSPNYDNINIYVEAQKKILNSAIKQLKRLEKSLLTDPQNKKSLITLKNIIKKDKKFADSLLVSLGITSYDQLVENQFQDQAWLLYLMRCYNRKEYEDEDENYLPEWIYESFERIIKEKPISPQEILQYREIYEGLIIPLTQTAPDVFNRGDWTVEKLIYSARLLDTISFVRGKEQECIIVQP